MHAFLCETALSGSGDVAAVFSRHYFSNPQPCISHYRPPGTTAKELAIVVICGLVATAPMAFKIISDRNVIDYSSRLHIQHVVMYTYRYVVSFREFLA